MENRDTPNKGDILQEPYKGTGPVVSGLGYGVIETKVMWFAGLLGGGIIGVLAPKHINNLSDSWQARGIKAVENNPAGSGGWGAVKRGFGHSINKIFEWSGKLADHMPGKDYAAKHLGGASSNRMKAAISAGGIASIAAIAFSVVHSMFVGAKSAADGKNQFERARSEIKTLRDEKQALTEELETTSKELAKLKAQDIKLRAETKAALPSASIADIHHEGHVAERDGLSQSV